MTVSKQGFAALLAPGFRKVWVEDWKENPMIGSQLVNRVSSSSPKAYFEDHDVAGMGATALMIEGGVVTYADPVDGSTKRYVPAVYGLGFRCTEQMIDDELYGVFGAKMTKLLGVAIRNNQELMMHQPYNQAFSTSFTGFRSGESLCSTAHTNINVAGTVSNRNDVDFSLTALQAALEHFESLTDEAGMPRVLNPNLVLHTIADKWLVNQILKSQYLPGTNQNDINVVASEGLRPLQSRFLSDSDSWYVIDTTNHDINYWLRKAPTLKSQDDFDTGDVKTKSTVRHVSGFGKWQGVFGSSGA